MKWSFERAAAVLGITVISEPEEGALSHEMNLRLGGQAWKDKIWINRDPVHAQYSLSIGIRVENSEAHELAHHVLGHTRIEPSRLPADVVEYFEWEARMVAASVIARLGLGLSDPLDHAPAGPDADEQVRRFKSAADKIIAAGTAH